MMTAIATPLLAGGADGLMDIVPSDGIVKGIVHLAHSINDFFAKFYYKKPPSAYVGCDVFGVGVATKDKFSLIFLQ